MKCSRQMNVEDYRNSHQALQDGSGASVNEPIRPTCQRTASTPPSNKPWFSGQEWVRRQLQNLHRPSSLRRLTRRTGGDSPTEVMVVSRLGSPSRAMTGKTATSRTNQAHSKLSCQRRRQASPALVFSSRRCVIARSGTDSPGRNVQ